MSRAKGLYPRLLCVQNGLICRNVLLNVLKRCEPRSVLQQLNGVQYQSANVWVIALRILNPISQVRPLVDVLVEWRQELRKEWNERTADSDVGPQ